MADIFVSYARSSASQAQRIAQALRGLGYGVWRDDELPAHRSYAEVIEERLKAAKAVVVIWSDEAVKSEWVRSEADRARNERKLVQLSVDGTVPPMPFDQIQCADLSGWSGDLAAPGWRKVASSIADLIGPAAPAQAPAEAKGVSICVLPFANMSGDQEQEYFSDGISEDIITDLSKVSALSVVARNTTFAFKGKAVDIPQLARQTNASHVLEGSVRKVGNRVRITAQLINGSTGNHIWAERYDRDLSDIFALQDEISQAIVAALRVKLLPEEKKAIAQRGTTNAEAYQLFLMARQYGIKDSVRYSNIIIRLCQKALALDPGYATAWAKLSRAQRTLRAAAIDAGDPWESVKRALDIDPDCPEARAANALLYLDVGKFDIAETEIARALELDPDSYEVIGAAGIIALVMRRHEEAIGYLEKSAAMIDTDFAALSMSAQCHAAIGDDEGAKRAARQALERIEKEIAQDPANASAVAHGATLFTLVGDAERAKSWAARAMLIDPDNRFLVYNLGCAMIRMGEIEQALDYFETFFQTALKDKIVWADQDSDLDPIRDHPRFKAMMAVAKERVAAAPSLEPETK